MHRQYAGDSLLVCTEQPIRDVAGNATRPRKQSPVKSPVKYIVKSSQIPSQISIQIHSSSLIPSLISELFVMSLLALDALSILPQPNPSLISALFVMSCHVMSLLALDALSIPPPPCSRTITRRVETSYRQQRSTDPPERPRLLLLPAQQCVPCVNGG